MSRPTSGKRKSARASAATLHALGADRLAELLWAAAKADPALKRTLTLEVASDAEHLACEIDRQIERLHSGKGRVTGARATKLARELERLVQVTAGKLADMDPDAAVVLLTRVLEIGPGLLSRRTGEGRPLVEMLAAVSVRIGEVIARMPSGADQTPIVEPLFTAFLADPTGVAKPLMAQVAPALQPEGHRVLQALVEAELTRTAADGKGAAMQRRLHLTSVLGHLADAADDADAYVAAQARSDARLRDHVGSAARLHAAGRSAEAMALLEGAPVGAVTTSTPFVAVRIELLDALGRREEAQAARWRWFETTLLADALRQHLKRLTDFDDVEQEEKALAYVTAHSDTTAALSFLTAWPDLRRAAALVRARQGRLKGEAAEALGAAASPWRTGTRSLRPCYSARSSTPRCTARAAAPTPLRRATSPSARRWPPPSPTGRGDQTTPPTSPACGV